MEKKEAVWILENGAWWDSLPDDMSDADKTPLLAAIDIAIAALKMPEKSEPLTIEQLRKMEGNPVWVDFTGSTIEREPGWFILKDVQGEEAYLVGEDSVYKAYEYYGKTWRAYAYPPAHIDREAWTAKWVKHDGYTECSKCEHWYDSPESEDAGDQPAFCPSCGRAMTPEAWAELEKRLRGCRE